MDKYFNDIPLLQNTLLPYFCDQYPLVCINKKFKTLNYAKYNTLLQPHGIVEIYYNGTKIIEEKITYKNGKKRWFI
jgi:hypothetical protein